jgi:hypothetical protein
MTKMAGLAIAGIRIKVDEEIVEKKPGKMAGQVGLGHYIFSLHARRLRSLTSFR